MQDVISTESGKIVTLRDLSNIAARNKTGRSSRTHLTLLFWIRLWIHKSDLCHCVYHVASEKANHVVLQSRRCSSAHLTSSLSQMRPRREFVRSLFEPIAWNHIVALINDKKANHVCLCGCCNGSVKEMVSILCGACLSWYHLNVKCCGLARQPKKKHWICSACYQTASF